MSDYHQVHLITGYRVKLPKGTWAYDAEERGFAIFHLFKNKYKAMLEGLDVHFVIDDSNENIFVGLINSPLHLVVTRDCNIISRSLHQIDEQPFRTALYTLSHFIFSMQIPGNEDFSITADPQIFAVYTTM